MFFAIAKETKENFSHHYDLGSFVISTDAGWKKFTGRGYQILYKGYADSVTLETAVLESIEHDIPQYTGNFCAIVYDMFIHTISIKTDRYRSFPIYFKFPIYENTLEQEVTNLIKYKWTEWSNSLLTIDKDFIISQKDFDIVGDISTFKLSTDEVINGIDSILTDKTQNFLKNNTLPIKAHLSGGVDSLLVYSYLKKYTENFELVKCAHHEYDEFWLKNSYDVTQNWGYTQIHHWKEPCVLISGCPGDEFTLRGPATAENYLNFYNNSILDLLQEEKWKDTMQSIYFLREKNVKVIKEQSSRNFNTEEELFHYICDNVLNDWQHWHLGNTLTWTPLRDPKITKLIMRLPLESAIGQILNSNISCALIENNCPGLTDVLVTKKNNRNQMENLVKFLK